MSDDPALLHSDRFQFMTSFSLVCYAGAEKGIEGAKTPATSEAGSLRKETPRRPDKRPRRPDYGWPDGEDGCGSRVSN